MIDVFIIGSKGIPAKYGGFETFVEKLTENRSSSNIKYHVACAVEEMPEKSEFEHNGAHCFCIKWRPIGAARAIAYDIDAFEWAIRYAENMRVTCPVFYVLASRIGPFIGRFAKRVHAMGGFLFVNPDGHEWKRAKWSAPVRQYWKLSERGMVKHADLVICDSVNIQRYVEKDYQRLSPKTTYIAYGADVTKSLLSDGDSGFTGWLKDRGLKTGGYYLAVGRFVPENNFETMIREFMASNSKQSFALVTGIDEKFIKELEAKTGFASDSRIKFVGTVYDQELLKKIRENAFAYIHGHEVGGTNPSLLEALASTRLNLLLDVGFNSEVAEDAALYWTKEQGSLSGLIESVERFNDEVVQEYSTKSTNVIQARYCWRSVCDTYERLFASYFAT